jgi:hypothetical protein
MTAYEYIEEIKLRLTAYSVGQEADDLQLLTFLNNARKRVQYDTLAKYPERYGVVGRFVLDPTADIYDLYSNENQANADLQDVDVYRITLPINFIDSIVVKLCFELEESDYEYEARRMTKYEMFSISQHIHNKPTFYSPVYAIAREGGVYYLYISSLKNGADLITDSPEIEIWYTAVIADLQMIDAAGVFLGDTDTVIARELEELVILYTIFLYMQQANAQEYISFLALEIQDQLQTLMPLYQLDKVKADVELASQEGMQ